MRIGETPVLISNTMVKTYTADDTTLETAWESRWLPDYFLKKQIQLKIIKINLIRAKHINIKLHVTYLTYKIKIYRFKIYKSESLT